MNKGKKTRANTFTEMHFVSSLPLKKSVKLMGELSLPETPVTLTELNSDTWRFEIDYLPAEDEPAFCRCARYRVECLDDVAAA